MIFFVKQKTAYEMRISDWSSDVCSSDLDNRQAVFSTGQSIEPRYWNPKERKPRQTVAINWQKIDRELDNIADWTRRIFEAYTAKYDAYPEPAKLVELCLIAIKTKGESVAPEEKPTDFIAFAKLIADETETGQQIGRAHVRT